MSGAVQCAVRTAFLLPWLLAAGDPSTYVPPVDYFIDVLPYSLVFGFGLAVMVAPLTTALMRSVPSRQAGLASAINNAVSRVGPQLAGALIFVVITAGFYASLAEQVPGLDPSSPELRAQVSPLNPPEPGTPPEVAAAAHTASTDSFHVAMLTGTLLLAVGAAVNWFGISDPQALVAANSERRGLTA